MNNSYISSANKVMKNELISSLNRRHDGDQLADDMFFRRLFKYHISSISNHSGCYTQIRESDRHCLKRLEINNDFIIVPEDVYTFGSKSILVRNGSFVIFSDNVAEVYDDVFDFAPDCERFSVIFLNPDTIIHGSPFKNRCLEYVYLPENMREIPAEMFMDCEIGCIWLPQKLKRIRSKAFMDSRINKFNTGYADFTVDEDAFLNVRTFWWEKTDGYNDFFIVNKVLYSVHGMSEDIIIPQGVEEIAKDALYYEDFDYMPDVRNTLSSPVTTFTKRIVIPSTVKVIKDGAFRNAEGLEQILIYSNRVEFGKEVFTLSVSIETINTMAEIPMSAIRKDPDWGWHTLRFRTITPKKLPLKLQVSLLLMAVQSYNDTLLRRDFIEIINENPSKVFIGIYTRLLRSDDDYCETINHLIDMGLVDINKYIYAIKFLKHRTDIIEHMIEVLCISEKVEYVAETIGYLNSLRNPG